MKRKYSSVVLVLLSVLLILSGCAGESTSNNNSEGGSTTQINFMHWRGEDKAVLDGIIAEFEKANPDITVEMTIYPSDQYMATAQRMLQEGSTGDVFTSFPGAQFESLQKAGVFEDLSGEEFVSNFDENLITVGQKDGKQLALPYQLVFNMPIYNKGMFDELGLEVPKSWEEFQALCDTLLENGITPIAFPGADIGPNQFMNSMMMNNAPDEDIFAKLQSGEEKLTNEWWVKTLEDFQLLEQKGYIQKNALGTNQDSAMQMVASEEAAMLATGSYHMASLIGLNPDLQLDLLAPITVEESEAQYEGINTATFMLAVNSNSEKKEQAKKFIDFVSQPENAAKYANETGQHLTVKDVKYESEVLKNTAYWITDKTTRFQPRFLITNAQVEDAVLSSIEDVLGGAEPMDAAEAAQKIVDENRE
ncbi:carbohydrate ABC transporter substrate-binding protein (CUT1 family) [Planomicrobium soli]|uniref:Carbohydrate ABC transporter substrate-binding protein (CUT1 family) n=1 Tax=Planomicrobium soli TaxID=1176648 RepID=A0A2P8H266_9BACL|nr:extracellular solute-binding protein [Planomicrobium soli]PSL40301.1 carbohydrate ABC transporter substrate-binding protein (CUT1 family) [Planomicrobium soli]